MQPVWVSGDVPWPRQTPKLVHGLFKEWQIDVLGIGSLAQYAQVFGIGQGTKRKRLRQAEECKRMTV